MHIEEKILAESFLIYDLSFSVSIHVSYRSVYLPASLHLDASSFALLVLSASLSQSRSAKCAYALAGVAWVTRVVVTIPVDIPAFSASARMDTTLLCSVKEAQYFL